MRVLIAEDEIVARTLLEELLSPYGQCDAAEDGQQALDQFRAALEQHKPYQLLCLDIRMPLLDGQQVLKEVRRLERERGIAPDDGIKILMITALEDDDNVLSAYRSECDMYLPKPIARDKLIEELRFHHLIAPQGA